TIDQFGRLFLRRALDHLRPGFARRQILELSDARARFVNRHTQVGRRPDRNLGLRSLTDADERRVARLVDVLHHADDGRQLAGHHLLALFEQSLDLDRAGAIIDGENLRHRAEQIPAELARNLVDVLVGADVDALFAEDDQVCPADFLYGR